ncbi:hypothetical protein [Geobacter sp.]|nr:hypothetical protein [Geobacter sp.]
MFKRFMIHLATRREFNRTKRILRERAVSRCLVPLLHGNGALRRLP